jgi:hypothetical protein
VITSAFLFPVERTGRRLTMNLGQRQKPNFQKEGIAIMGCKADVKKG